MSEDCLFCKIVAGELSSDTVYEDDLVYAFRDINPAAPTHVLIVPRRHLASLNAVEDGDVDLLGRIMLAAKKIAEQEGLSNGYRVLTNIGPDASQVVFHMHVHVMGGHKLRAGLG
jgi:histidine triad (HIT) family protein